MARPRVYGDRVPKELGQDVLSLFGKIRNAYEKLRLAEAGVAFERFQAIIRSAPCLPEERQLVEHRWLEWRYGYLKAPFSHGDWCWQQAFEELVTDPDSPEWRRANVDAEL